MRVSWKSLGGLVEGLEVKVIVIFKNVVLPINFCLCD